MTKYLLKRTLCYDQWLEIEAKDQQEAIARSNSFCSEQWGFKKSYILDGAVSVEIVQEFEKDKIFVSWHIDDVKQRVMKMCENQTISDEGAREVLYNLKRHHDPIYGITWEHIDDEVGNWLRDGNDLIEVKE